MTDRPLEVLLHHLPGVIARAENEWARNFAKSIMRQSKRRNWKPSPKQAEILQRLVADLFREDEISLIEDEN